MQRCLYVIAAMAWGWPLYNAPHVFLFCGVQLSLGLIKSLLMGHSTSVFLHWQWHFKFWPNATQMCKWRAATLFMAGYNPIVLKAFIIVQRDICLLIRMWNYWESLKSEQHEEGKGHCSRSGHCNQALMKTPDSATFIISLNSKQHSAGRWINLAVAKCSELQYSSSS